MPKAKLVFDGNDLGWWSCGSEGICVNLDEMTGEWEDPSNQIANGMIKMTADLEPILGCFIVEEGFTKYFRLEKGGHLHRYDGPEPWTPELDVEDEFHKRMRQLIIRTAAEMN